MPTVTFVLVEKINLKIKNVAKHVTVFVEFNFLSQHSTLEVNVSDFSTKQQL